MTTTKELLQQAKDAGATFGECIEVFGIKRDSDPITKTAFDKYHREGELEIDETTVRSGSDDDGDYVLAWVWVYNSDVTRLCMECGDILVHDYSGIPYYCETCDREVVL